jgi:hypothetical protein
MGATPCMYGGHDDQRPCQVGQHQAHQGGAGLPERGRLHQGVARDPHRARRRGDRRVTSACARQRHGPGVRGPQRLRADGRARQPDVMSASSLAPAARAGRRGLWWWLVAPAKATLYYLFHQALYLIGEPACRCPQPRHALQGCSTPWAPVPGSLAPPGPQARWRWCGVRDGRRGRPARRYRAGLRRRRCGRAVVAPPGLAGVSRSPWRSRTGTALVGSTWTSRPP